MKGLVLKKKKNPEQSKEILRGKKKAGREGCYRSLEKKHTGRCLGHFPMPVWDHHISGEATKMFRPEKIKPQDRSGNKSRIGFLISAD